MNSNRLLKKLTQIYPEISIWYNRTIYMPGSICIIFFNDDYLSMLRFKLINDGNRGPIAFTYGLTGHPASALTDWGRVTHICVGNLYIIGSGNGLSPGRRQAITWTNDGTLLTGTLGTNFSETLIKIYTF